MKKRLSEMTIGEFFMSLAIATLLVIGVDIVIWDDTMSRIETYANDIQRMKYYLWMHEEGGIDTKLINHYHKG